MHLKIKMLSLNDIPSDDSRKDRAPTSEELCDATISLWKEDPDTEALPSSQLFARVVQRCSEWSFDQETFETMLVEKNLYSLDETKLPVYSHLIQVPEMCPDLTFNHAKTSNQSSKYLENVKILSTSNNHMGRGLFAKKDFKPGQLIYVEEDPICVIPAIEKLALISRGKICALCNVSLGSISSHFIMKNGLDCNTCASVWCSKKCKSKDIIHGALKHNKGNKNKLVNCANWNKFEAHCQRTSNDSAYSLGIIFAQLLLNKDSSKRNKQYLEALCGVSQRVRVRGQYSIQESETSVDKFEDKWREVYALFIESFPTLADNIDFETFLFCIGKFNINKLSNNQIYFISSFINHHCEPNVRYEFDSKLKLSLYARKEIKKGDQLYITYVNPLHGVILRRRELRVQYGFICKCCRCKKELEHLEIYKNDKDYNRDEITKNSKLNKNSIDELNGGNVVKNQENRNNEMADTLTMLNSTGKMARRKSSMRNQRPDLQELLKNGQEFELEIPGVINIGGRRRRRTSVRFNETVSMAVEE